MGTTSQEHASTWVNLRANSYYLALSNQRCWKCKASTHLVAVGLPIGYEEEVEPGRWQRAPEPTLLRNIHRLSPHVVERLCAGHKGYRFAQSKSAKISYWFNHCLHCDAKQGDHMAHSQPGGAFFPTTPEEAAGVVLVNVAEPIEVSAGGFSLGIGLIEHMHVYARP